MQVEIKKVIPQEEKYARSLCHPEKQSSFLML